MPNGHKELEKKLGCAYGLIRVYRTHSKD